MRPIRLAVAALALLAAAAAALLAADVARWHEELRVSDARFQIGRGGRVTWNAPARVPLGLARRLLAVDDDRATRRALQLFRAAYRGPEPVDVRLERQGARGAAQAALADVAKSPDPFTASQAMNLLGILAFATPGRGTAAMPAERSRGAFDAALRLDPANADAKANLELVLRLLEPGGLRSGPRTGGGTRRGGGRGAGGGAAGRGY